MSNYCKLYLNSITQQKIILSQLLHNVDKGKIKLIQSYSADRHLWERFSQLLMRDNLFSFHAKTLKEYVI